MERPPMASTSWATATLETVARPMWLSGMRKHVATGAQHADLVAHPFQVGRGGGLDLADELEGTGAGRHGPVRLRVGKRSGHEREGRGTASILAPAPGASRPPALAHSLPVFTPVPPDTDFVALEQAELARWSAHRVFERSIEQRKGAPAWVFYEGPPTANGMPGLHHVWARVYKDLFCRFRTMDGNYVARRAGWDTHGLPVEVEVEKKLGITGKQQIEEQVGIAEFTRLCRESVYSYVDEFARLTTRIGYWVDMDAAYWTLSPDYIESVWWHLQQLFDQGLLYEDLKVVPYCPRCGTALSSHELGQPDVYRDEEDESAYVRFRLVGDGERGARAAPSGWPCGRPRPGPCSPTPAWP